jgi:hypothetical protein
MATPVAPTIREVLLSEIKAHEPKGPIDASLQQLPILSAAAAKIGRGNDEAILTQWGELFRTGILAWGLNLSNPNAPFFHLTERGRAALANLTRDPSNPAGYLRHLASIGAIDAIAMSYLTEGLECYVAGLFKAAAVMVGAAAEAMILNLRDATHAKLAAIGRSVPKGMMDWKIKTVSEALATFFNMQKAGFAPVLKDGFEAYWSAFALQIRTTRNDAGHPISVDPVSPDAVHAALLVFPELARLTIGLVGWVGTGLK